VGYRFSNATIDDVLDDMMAAKTAAKAKEYAIEATKLLAYEQPMIVAYNDAWVDGYRIDDWEGHMEFKGRGIVQSGNPYGYYNIRLKEDKGGPYGGTYKPVFSEGWESTNVLQQTEGYNMNFIVWSGLMNVDPNNWEFMPDLAYEWEVEETTKGAGGVEDGQKFTFKLLENATWHDGKPVTADDCKFTYDEVWPTSPELSYLIDNVYMTKAPDKYTFEIYTNASGYFEFGDATGINILPKHVWEDHGPDYHLWVPKASEMIGSGPYK
jgi:ABC-type transport system substrate-binding protein